MNTSLSILENRIILPIKLLLIFSFLVTSISASGKEESLNCHPIISPILDDNCEATITPALILSDVFMDYSVFTLEIEGIGTGNLLTITGSDLINVTIMDLDGNECSSEITAVDTSPPTIDAFSSITITMSCPFDVELLASDVNVNATDACSSNLEYLIQKPSLLLGQMSPPTSATSSALFDVCDMPFANVDIWVGDGYGNWSYNIVQVIIESDMQTSCDCFTTLFGTVKSEENEAIENVNVSLSLVDASPIQSMITNEGGGFGFSIYGPEDLSLIHI